MPKIIPKSLKDAILEEPERFIKYLKIDKITSSKNPYSEFLNQFQKKFNSTQGLNLWQYLVERYNLLNKLYKQEDLQEELPENFRGSLKRKEVKTFFKNYEKRTAKQQEKREIEIKKPIKVSTHKRKDKTITNYTKSKGHHYTDRQKRFILSRRDYPLKQLSDEFNRYFDTNVTFFGIRDKRLRLLGKKT